MATWLAGLRSGLPCRHAALSRLRRIARVDGPGGVSMALFGIVAVPTLVNNLACLRDGRLVNVLDVLVQRTLYLLFLRLLLGSDHIPVTIVENRRLLTHRSMRRPSRVLSSLWRIVRLLTVPALIALILIGQNQI